MEPSESLQTAENALRLIVREVLGATWESKFGDLDRLRLKREDERKRRDGAVVSDDLLSFTEFHELVRIIMQNWDPAFHPVFGDKARTKLWIEALADIRNAIAHSRPLLQFERDLASGVAGQLRNQITIYRTSKEPANQHYPVIESVRDSFGQTGVLPNTYFGNMTLLRVDVGDELSFDCTGSDQRGRDLEWILYGAADDFTEEVLASARGTSVTLRWIVQERYVGESKFLHVRLRAVGSKYFRHKTLWPIDSYDDSLGFPYAVNPPYE